MKYIPIKFHVVYIIFTLLFAFFGPKVYIGFNKPLLLLFMISYLIVVMIGFYLGVNSKISFYKESAFRKNTIVKLLKFSIKFSIIFYIINIIYLVINGRFNISISSMGENYVSYYQYYQEKTEAALFTFENIFVVITAIPKYISLVLGFFYFSLLSKKYKKLFFLFLGLIIITQTVAIGNQKSLGDIVIFGLIALVVKTRDMLPAKRNKIIKRSFMVLLLMFVLFSFTQYARLASRGISAFDINSFQGDYNYYDFDNFIFKIFGDKMGLGIAAFITGYLSGGYQGLSLCLQLPFEWTYGVGNSVGMSNIIEKSFDVDIYSHTYLFRMEQAYGLLGKQRWHTIFPWLASDFTFFGTIILFFFIAYFYGKSWKELLMYKNPISLLLFSLLSVLFVFVPANNQILHGFDYLVITSFVVLLWRFYHKKYNFQ